MSSINLIHSLIFIFTTLSLIVGNDFFKPKEIPLNLDSKKSFKPLVFEILLIYSLKTSFCSLERDLYFLLNLQF